MSLNVFQAGASAHQPERVVLTEEDSLDAVRPDSTYLMMPSRHTVDLELWA